MQAGHPRSRWLRHRLSEDMLARLRHTCMSHDCTMNLTQNLVRLSHRLAGRTQAIIGWVQNWTMLALGRRCCVQSPQVQPCAHLECCTILSSMPSASPIRQSHGSAHCSSSSWLLSLQCMARCLEHARRKCEASLLTTRGISALRGLTEAHCCAGWQWLPDGAQNRKHRACFAEQAEIRLWLQAGRNSPCHHVFSNGDVKGV